MLGMTLERMVIIILVMIQVYRELPTIISYISLERVVMMLCCIATTGIYIHMLYLNKNVNTTTTSSSTSTPPTLPTTLTTGNDNQNQDGDNEDDDDDGDHTPGNEPETEPTGGVSPVSIYSTQTNDRAELINWSQLRSIVPKNSNKFTFHDREIVKSFNLPPLLSMYSNWRDYKSSIYYWVARLCRVGYSPSDLYIQVKTKSLNCASLTEPQMVIKQNMLSIPSCDLIEVLEQSDIKLSSFTRALSTTVNRELPLCRRLSGFCVVRWASRMAYLFERESNLVKNTRSENDRVELCLVSLQLNSQLTSLVRLSMNQESIIQNAAQSSSSSGNSQRNNSVDSQYSMNALIVTLTRLNINDLKAYDSTDKHIPVNAHERSLHNKLENLVATCDQSNFEQSVADGGSVDVDEGNNKKEKKKGTSHKTNGGGNPQEDDKTCLNSAGQLAPACKYGVFCRNYISNKGCTMGHNRKERVILDKLKNQNEGPDNAPSGKGKAKAKAKPKPKPKKGGGKGSNDTDATVLATTGGGGGPEPEAEGGETTTTE